MSLARDYIYASFAKSSQALAGLEKALHALGLLDQSMTKVTARARARAAKSKLDAQQRDHEKLVEDAVTAYYDADDQRTAALAALTASDDGRAAAVTTLVELNESPQRIAALVGLSTTKIRKLRRTPTVTTKTAKKTDTDKSEDTGAAGQDGPPDRARTAAAGSGTSPTTAEPENEPEPEAAALAS